LNTKIYTSAMKTIPNAPWGLSRIAHRYSNDDTYIYNNAQRFFPVVYILDSGIYTRHTVSILKRVFKVLKANMVYNNLAI
jgi:hypothetical protein